jgi:hypothetical protein
MAQLHDMPLVRCAIEITKLPPVRTFPRQAMLFWIKLQHTAMPVASDGVLKLVACWPWKCHSPGHRIDARSIYKASVIPLMPPITHRNHFLQLSCLRPGWYLYLSSSLPLWCSVLLLSTSVNSTSRPGMSSSTSHARTLYCSMFEALPNLATS